MRDLAIALMRRGHYPTVYSTVLGEVAVELRGATVPVVDDLGALNLPPDIIHGQHHLETMSAALRFPDTPIVHVCHGWRPWEETPAVLPNIRRYIAVDDLCRERLLSTRGIAADQVDVLLNFVDLDRFRLRSALPARPGAALVFSNYASDNATLQAIRSACARYGITKVDVVGGCSGKSIANPEKILGNYDIVFAKARCALEAMASGCAVVVADYAGLGGLVTMDNVAQMRRLNFGARTMQQAEICEERVLQQLHGYDGDNARRVSHWIRGEADMSLAVARWIEIYRELLGSCTSVHEGQGVAAYRFQLAAASDYLRWLSPILKKQHEVDARLGQAAQMEASLLQRAAGFAETGERLRQCEADLAHAVEQLRVQDSESGRIAERLALREAEGMAARNDLRNEVARGSELAAQLQQRESELRVIQASPGWRAISRYRAMLAWLRQLKG